MDGYPVSNMSRRADLDVIDVASDGASKADRGGRANLDAADELGVGSDEGLRTNFRGNAVEG